MWSMVESSIGQVIFNLHNFFLIVQASSNPVIIFFFSHSSLVKSLNLMQTRENIQQIIFESFFQTRSICTLNAWDLKVKSMMLSFEIYLENLETKI